MTKTCRTVRLNSPVYAAYGAAVGGNEESKSPLAAYFDKFFTDPYLGESSWERAESRLQFNAVNLLLEKTNLLSENIDMMFGGDLINQCTSTYFSARDLSIPLYGIYAACATMAEALQLGCMAICGGFAKNVISVTSSHFCSSEKQFRFPLEYGGQRPPTSQWTVTASGAVLLTTVPGNCKITHITTGKITDMGVTDANNMGAGMAPAAADTIENFLTYSGVSLESIDLIVTGDLGVLGKSLLHKLLYEKGIDIASKHKDCGCMIYNCNLTDKHCGGSGPGACASVFAGHLLPQLKSGKLKNLLFVPTGALMSPLSCRQGESISGVAHAVFLQSEVAE